MVGPSPLSPTLQKRTRVLPIRIDFNRKRRPPDLYSGRPVDAHRWSYWTSYWEGTAPERTPWTATSHDHAELLRLM